MKKKIFLISSLAIVIIIIMVVFYLLRNKVDKISEPICAIPPEVAMIIELNSPEDFYLSMKEKSGMFADFAELLNLKYGNSIFHCIDTLGILDSSKINNKIIWSFHPEGINPFTQLIVIKPSEKIKQNKYISEINDKLSVNGNVSEREFKDVIVYEYNSNNNLGSLNYYCKNGLLVLSFSQKLIEKSIESLINSKSVNDIVPEFISLYATAGKNEIANVFVNMSIFSKGFLAGISENNKDIIKRLEHFSAWTELDLNFSDDILSLNGFSKGNDSTTNFTQILKSQKPSNLKCINVLPDNTLYYFAMSFNNIEGFRQTLTEYNNSIGLKQECISKFSETKQDVGIDVNASFYPLVNNEVCLAVTTPGAFDLLENSYLIFGVKSEASAKIELANIINAIKLNTGMNDAQLKDKIYIDENTSLDVFILPFEGLPEMLFGHYFSACSGKYVCCLNNFMIFANSKSSMFKIVYDIILNKTLETSINHNLFLENFSESSNLFIYFSMLNGYGIFKSLLNDEKKQIITEKAELLSSFGNFGYQINKSNDMLYNNLVVKKQKYLVEKPKTVWESRLSNTVSVKPVLDVNHDNNTKEILVQDHDNNLYLLSNSGREIWRVGLDEKIQSDVYQIDLYKNGKLQYLFSTRNKIYLIDRLGNNVDKYPIKLRASATAPMSLFDYNDNKNYRIIIPCENNEVYLYDAEGDLVKGWKFDKSENIINTEIHHYCLDGEDFIVFKDKYKAYFLNRKGETKLDYLTKFEFSNNNPMYLDYTYSKKRFVTTDKNGMLRFFYKNGKQDSLKIKDFSEEHYFMLKDVNSDGSNDYVFLDGKCLEVYNRQKKLLFAYTFDAKPSSKPVFYSFPRNQIKIGIVCSSTSKIFLLNNDGSLFDGFPLYGLTPFSIGYLSSDSNMFNLIVGGQENLLYNYEVNEN